MKKLIFSAALLIFTLNHLSAQATLIEKVESVPGKLIIPYSKFMLPNGLTLIVSEDHSDQVVHLNVTYHVGSARETPGKSGFAHFFEHMLFQGSKHVADEEHFKIIKEYGGDVNGNTTRDRTVYIETFPSNFTETALWMEADRMGFFLEAFTKKKFEVQRETVKNEKAQRFDAPYGFLLEVKDQEFYPSEHPYSWSTIGFVDDLNRADSTDLRNFFLRWYGPNNACIIVSGDVNTTEVVQWVEKYFGSIPKGREVKKKRVKPVVFETDKIKSYPDPNAYVPLMYITYPGVPVYHEDEAALDLLSYLMGNTKSSVLYKKFIDNEMALQIGASNNPLSAINHELAGEFSFTLAGYPWSDMFKLKARLMQVLDSFEYVNFSDDDLMRAKSNLLATLSNGLESADNKANYLSNYWYLDLKNAQGKTFNLEDEIDRFKNITKEDIMRVYRKYLKGKKSSTIDIQPYKTTGDEKAPKFESFNPNVNFASDALDIEYKNLTPRLVVDNFDRSKKPTPKTIKPVSVPKIYKETLANEAQVLGTEFNETPNVLIQVTFKGGALFEDGKNIPAGTADMMANCLDLGTKNKTPEQLENALEKLGANISFSSSKTRFVASLYCPKDKVKEATALLEEILTEPRWDNKEFEKTQKRIIESTKSSLSNRSLGMMNAWNRINYGESILGKYTSAEDYGKVKLTDCKRYYEQFISANLAKVIVVGPLTKEESKNALSFVAKIPNRNLTAPLPSTAAPMQTSQLFGVQYADADQSDIMLGFKTLPFDYNGDFYKSSIMNFALAGNFNSRLNLKIREEKAWTYGIRGNFNPSYENLPGFYTVSAGIKANATDSALSEIIWTVEEFKEKGMTQEEFDFTKSALIASEALDYESLGQKAGFIGQMAARDLPENYTEEQLKILQSISKDELNAIAKKYLNTEEMVIVVAGDMLLLKDRLEKLGMGKVQVLNKDGSGKIKYYKAGSSKHKKNYK